MNWLTIIWSIFTIIFFALGFYQWQLAGKSIEYLKIKMRQNVPDGVVMKATVAGIDFNEFVSNFNSYIDHYNQKSKSQHKIQAIGFWVASATAIFSLILSIVG